MDGTVAVHVAVEAWPVPTLLHDLAQQPLGLAVETGRGGGATNTLVTTVTECTQKPAPVSHFSLSDVKEVFR